MAVTVIRNATLHVTSEEFVDVSAFAISDRKIVPFTPSLIEDGTAEELDFSGMHVAPGLIDLLINGCNGVSFAQNPTVETLEHMRRYLTLKGVTTFVPTIISGPRENLSNAVSAVSDFMNKHPTVCPGLHMEGPFISPNFKGFHPSGYIRPFTVADMEFIKEFKDCIAYMTIAPEVVKPKNIVELLSNKVRLSIGHTACSYFEAVQSFKAGINNITHIYNGMAPAVGREPGVIGAVMQSERVFASVIADGRHVHPALIKLLKKILGNRMYIVSDSQPITGMSKAPSTFVAGGSEIFVDQKRGLIDSKGSYAGTSINMLDGIKFLINKCDFSLDEALIAASYAPARALGLDDFGCIETGNIADLIVFDDDLKIQYVIQNGFVKSIAELM